MTNAIDEYFKLKAQLGEPLLELETETSVSEKRKGGPPKTEIAARLKLGALPIMQMITLHLILY